MTYRPDWLAKYKEVGFDASWADNILEKYSDSFLEQLPNSMAPENFVQTDPLRIESDAEILRSIYVPEDYSVTHSLRIYVDIVNEFGRAIPKDDKEIYQLYNRMEENPDFNFNCSFEQFYTFCRKTQYADLTCTEPYTLLKSAVEEQSFENGMEPPIGSHWTVTIDGTEIEVKVVEVRNDARNGLVDPNVTVEVVEASDSFETGDIVVISPEKFNKGTFRSL